jgi:hypothetical protein
MQSPPEKKKPRALAGKPEVKSEESSLTNNNAAILPYSTADVKNKTIFILETAFCHVLDEGTLVPTLSYVCPICQSRRIHFYTPEGRRLKEPRIRRINGSCAGGYLLAADEGTLRRICDEIEASEKGVSNANS